MATVLSVGSVTISANGGYTGDLLNKLINASSGAQTVAAGNGASLPAATGNNQELVIPANYTGSLVIPAGYAYVVYGGSGTLTGGSSGTAIIGSGAFSYTGAAGTVVATGGSGTVDETGSSALLSFLGGSYTVTASGGSDTVAVDTGSTAVVNTSGSNDVVVVGTPPTNVAVGALAAARAVGASGDTINANSGAVDNTVDVYSSGNTVNLNTTGDTVNATGSNNLINDFVGGNDVNLGVSTEYQMAPGITASTVTASAGGADTIIASSGIDYQGALAASSYFVGNNSTTVTAVLGTNDSVFGGAAAGSYTEGTGSFIFLSQAVGQTSSVTSDTIVGAAGSTQQGTIWGNSKEDLIVSQAGTAPGNLKGNVFIAYGSSDTINAQAARGDNSFIVWDAVVGGSNFSGNTTLVASSQGGDDVSLFAKLGAVSASSAHTITIENWSSSDYLYMGGYSAADDLTATNALKAANGSGATFTLSDNTTVHFMGNSPTSHI